MFNRVVSRIRQKFSNTPTIPAHLTEFCHRIKDKELTFLNMTQLSSLVSLCLEVERKKIVGTVIEAGCALGGSAIAMAKGKSPTREMFLYDTFEIIPPPTEHDGEDVHARYKTIISGQAVGMGGNPYYGYIPDKLDKVNCSFRDFGLPPDKHHVKFVKGLLEETMVVEGPISLAHIDVDWYDPVKVCLQRIAPRLSTGGMIVLDDYFAWSGCRKATDEFLAEPIGKNFSSDGRFGHLILRKK